MKTIRIKINPLLRRVPKARRNSAAHQQMRTSKRRKRRVMRHRHNPPRSHLYCVEAMVRTGPKRFKTYYWNGRDFTRDKSEAVHYSRTVALHKARQLLHKISPRVYALRVERIHTLKGNPRKSSFPWVKEGAGFIAKMPNEITLFVSPDYTTHFASKARRGTTWRAGASQWDEKTHSINRFGRDIYGTKFSNYKEAMKAAESVYNDA